MSVEIALGAYVVAAGLLTITPGLDTAVVLRALALGGPAAAALAALGVVVGLLAWGALVALGLAAVLAASALAYAALRWAGALYLALIGLRALLRPRSRLAQTEGPTSANWWRRGLMTNLLNPKVGVFYVSFLPQFTPAHVAAASFMLVLAAIHALLTAAWFGALVAAAAPLRRWLGRPSVVRWLDRASGVVFLAFGARLALERR